MSQFYSKPIEITAAGFSKTCNPLPPLRQLKSVPWPVEVGPDVLPEDRKYINYGCDNPLLPYLLQDDYDRNRSAKTYSAFILENKFLNATFLPDFGGRLWSLIYKPLNRELLYVNPVIQPCNLAYRDAWISGGVEWNMGMPAHNPFTCDKPFFAVIEDKGISYLRMYEWERITNAPFQVDFYLPPDAHFLHVRTKLINPHDYEIPGYWFSNIAVPEKSGHRVIVPADFAYTFDYSPERFAVKKVQIPDAGDLDVSYPTNIQTANDFFYSLNNDQWPWITSLDENGCGLVQASTSKLIGRKLFVWGMSPGGRRWQGFLSEPGNPYIEIQAGFGRTQVECKPLKPESETEWLEIYGYIENDSQKIHGKNWDIAVREVQNKLTEKTTLEQLEQELAQTREISNTRPDKILQYGSGWGALERIASGISEKGFFASRGIFFPDDSISEEQRDWLSLIEKGQFRESNPQKPLTGYQTQKRWKLLLQDSIAKEGKLSWKSFYYLGIIHYVEKEFDQAKINFHKSIDVKQNFLSYRMLAYIYLKQGSGKEAIENMDKAWRLNPLPQLAEEYTEMLVQLKMFAKCREILNNLEVDTLNRPRIKVVAAQTAFDEQNLDETERIINNITLTNIRECETTLTDLWFEIQTVKRARSIGTKPTVGLLKTIKATLEPPENIDFRMSEY